MFEKAFKEVLGFEGGYSNHRNDRGGKTKYGITETVAKRHGYRGKMKDLPLETAKEIYKVSYWDKQKLDEVAKLSPSIAIEMFECGVNCGTSVPQKFIQIALNALPLSRGQKLLAEDGKVGAKTIARLKLKTSDILTEETLYKLLNVQQGNKYLSIVRKNKSQKIFTRGWFKRVTL